MAEAAISKTASVLNWQATFTYRRIIRMQKNRQSLYPGLLER